MVSMYFAAFVMCGKCLFNEQDVKASSRGCKSDLLKTFLGEPDPQ
jgi:hypothetical protein